MRTYTLIAMSVSTLLAPVLLAQRGEFGAAGGGGFYSKRTITNRGASAEATFNNGPAGSVWLGQNVSGFIGGEIRYTFQQGKAKLTASGSQAELDARSHAVHYDLLFHFTRRGSRLRPYVLAGGGVKYFQGTGETRAVQPLGNVALLTPSNEVRALVTFGGGLKVNVTDHFQIRVEVRDYFSQFPNKIITPRSGEKIDGWLHNIVPLFGVAYTF
jgi:opacity protein-like surface antigen